MSQSVLIPSHIMKNKSLFGFVHNSNTISHSSIYVTVPLVKTGQFNGKSRPKAADIVEVMAKLQRDGFGQLILEEGAREELEEKKEMVKGKKIEEKNENNKKQQKINKKTEEKKESKRKRKETCQEEAN